MTSTLPAEALEGDIMVLGGAMAALEEVAEDLEVLDFHLMALECLLLVSEEDMEELAHTLMVAQALYMACQDLEGRGDIMHKLQLMVGNLLLTVPNLQSIPPSLQFMAPNLQFMMLNLQLM